MRFSQSVIRSLAVAGAAATVTLSIALAQPSKKPFEPQVGQPGKDVIWVPTPQALVEKMLDLDQGRRRPTSTTISAPATGAP